MRTDIQEWSEIRRKVLAQGACWVKKLNAKRPHRGIELRAPDSLPNPPALVPGMLRVRRCDVLGGLIHEYELVA